MRLSYDVTAVNRCLVDSTDDERLTIVAAAIKEHYDIDQYLCEPQWYDAVISANGSQNIITNSGMINAFASIQIL